MRMSRPRNRATPSVGQLLQPRANQIVVKVKKSLVVENVSPVVTRRIPAREGSAKNQIPVQRKIPPVKRRENPVLLKKQTVRIKSGQNKSLFPSLKS